MVEKHALPDLPRSRASTIAATTKIMVLDPHVFLIFILSEIAFHVKPMFFVMARMVIERVYAVQCSLAYFGPSQTLVDRAPSVALP